MLWAFVDESGQPNLEVGNPSVGTHYVLAAVLVDEPRLSGLRARVDELAARFASGGEIKASRLRQRPERMVEAVRALSEQPFQYCAVVVDKRRVDTESGLRFKRTFHKYFHGILYRWLYEAHPAVAVKADEVGRTSFMESFEPYVQKKRMRSLFDEHEPIAFMDSADERGIQAADLVAGVLADIHSDRMDRQLALACQELLLPRRLRVIVWGDFGISPTSSGSESNSVDYQIARAAHRSVQLYLEKAMALAEEGDHSLITNEVAHILQAHAAYGTPGEYLYADVIAEEASASGVGPVTADYVRRTAIPRLRDEGVLIVSTDNGYKLPDSVADLNRQLERDRDQLRPRLVRLRDACARLSAETVGAYNPLTDPRHDFLRRLVEVVHADHDGGAGST